MVQFFSNKVNIKRIAKKLQKHHCFYNLVQNRRASHMTNHHPYINGNSLFYVDVSPSVILKYYPEATITFRGLGSTTGFTINSDIYTEKYENTQITEVKQKLYTVETKYSSIRNKEEFNNLFSPTFYKIDKMFQEAEPSPELIGIVDTLLKEVLDFMSIPNGDTQEFYLDLLKREQESIRNFKISRDEGVK